MILITAVHLENGYNHEHITKVKWIDMKTQEKGTAPIAKIIEYINKNPKTVYVKDNEGYVEVFVIDSKPKYIRTKKDNRPSDNLLSLPEFY